MNTNRLRNKYLKIIKYLGRSTKMDNDLFRRFINL